MARIYTSIWSDPDWRGLTSEQQTFLIVCRAVGTTGACSDRRIRKYTGWDPEWIRVRRAELAGSPFRTWLTGNPKRRTLPPQLVCEVKARDNGRCRACGSTEELQIDHIFPVSLGGSDDIDNLQVLCRPCNQRKGVHVG